MTKNEYIERYGEEKYKEHLRKQYETVRLKKMGLYVDKRETAENDNLTVKMNFKIDIDEDYKERDERLEAAEKAVYKLQKQLSRWWSTQTDRKFILIVESGNKIKGKDLWQIKINLTQLNMTKEVTSHFKTAVVKKVNEIMEENEEC